MNKKEIIKNIIFILIYLLSVVIFVLGEKKPDILKPNYAKFHIPNVIFWISAMIASLLTFGFYCYITFKITKGKWFIYKDPNKPKTLNNIDFGESCPSMRYCPKFSNYSKYLPSPLFFGISAPSWCYYVKFFQLLGIFTFLEKDFNKTINSHNYFPISVSYYEKQKKLKK